MKTQSQNSRGRLIFYSILILFFANTIIAQDTHLWGVTNTGGENGYGTLYRTDLNGENYSQIHSFNRVWCGWPASIQLTYAQDGLMYGTTESRGTYGMGTIFSYNTETGALEMKFSFEGGAQGYGSRGGLVLANNSLLYGTTTFGGNNDIGIIYSFNSSNGVYTKVFDFNGSNGSLPHNRLLKASNGILYGMTYNGGAYNKGTLFSFSPTNNIFNKILDFDGTTTGGNPFGNLIQASNGLIYGMTTSGGQANDGVIFTLNTNTEIFSVIEDFIFSSGRLPYGGLLQTSDGYFWGTTLIGGTYDAGVIFRFNPFYNIFEVTVNLSPSFGHFPNGDLIEHSNGRLYGLTQTGGIADKGVLFSVDKNYPHTYSIEHEFDGINDGGEPLGSLAFSGSDKLIGVTQKGGFNNEGALFEYNVANNNFTKISDLYNANPFGLNPNDLIVRHDLARSRFPSLDPMYGTTKDGGQFDDGGIYSYNPISNTLALKASFNNDTTGREPSTITSSENGKFYGTTKLGGTNNYGTLFEYDPMAESLSALINFDATVIGGDSKGKIFEADNGLLYGTTTTGGPLGNGTLFSYDPSNQQLTKIIDFETSLGFSAKATLIQSNNGFIYGLCHGGGQYANGTIFKLDTNTNSVTKVADFNSEGKFPQVLVQGDNGLLYGIAQQGGNSDVGTIFEFDPPQSSLAKIHDFEAAASGAYPTGIMYNGEGKLVGTTQSGGNDDKGTVFEYDLNGNTFQVTHHFNGTNGEFPNMQSLQKLDDSLIGIDDYFETQSAIILYPNPVDDVFFLNGYEANQKFAIYNLLGQKVHESIIKSEKPIKAENLKSGIYILKLDDGRSIKLLKK